VYPVQDDAELIEPQQLRQVLGEPWVGTDVGVVQDGGVYPDRCLPGCRRLRAERRQLLTC